MVYAPTSHHDKNYTNLRVEEVGSLAPTSPPPFLAAEPLAPDQILSKPLYDKQEDINWTTKGLEAFRKAGLVDGKSYKLHKNDPLEKLIEPEPLQEIHVDHKFTGPLGEYSLSISDQFLLSFIKTVQELFYYTVSYIHKKGGSCPKALGLKKIQEILTGIAPSLSPLILAADASHIESYQGDSDYVIDLQESTPRFQFARSFVPSLKSTVISAIINKHHSILTFTVYHGEHKEQVSSFKDLVNYILKHNSGYGTVATAITQIEVSNGAIPSLKEYKLTTSTEPSLASLLLEITNWNNTRPKHFIYLLEDLACKYIFRSITNWEDYLDQLNPIINVSHTKFESMIIDGKSVPSKDWERVLCFNKFDLILMYKSLYPAHRTTSQQFEIDMMPVLDGKKFVTFKGNAQAVLEHYFKAISFINPERTSFSDWVHNLWRVTEGVVEILPETRLELKNKILAFCKHSTCPKSTQTLINELKERIIKNNFHQAQATSPSKAFCFLFNCSHDLQDDLSFHDMAQVWNNLSESYGAMPEGPLKTAALLVKSKTLPFGIAYAILHLCAYQASTSMPSELSKSIFKTSLTGLSTNSSLQLCVEGSVLHFPKNPLKSFQTVATYYRHLEELQADKALEVKGLIESLGLTNPATPNPASSFYSLGTPVDMEAFLREGENLLKTKSPPLVILGFKLLLDCLAREPSQQVWLSVLRYLPAVLMDSQNNPACIHLIRLLHPHLSSFIREKENQSSLILGKFLNDCLLPPFNLDDYIHALIADKDPRLEKIAAQVCFDRRETSPTDFTDPSKSTPSFALSVLTHFHEAGIPSNDHQILKIGEAILDSKGDNENIPQLCRLINLIAKRVNSKEGSYKNTQNLIYRWLINLLAKGKAPQALLFAQIASDSIILNTEASTLFSQTLALLKSFSSETKESDLAFLLNFSKKSKDPQVKYACHILYLEVILRWQLKVQVECKSIENLSAQWILNEPQPEVANKLFDSQIEQALYPTDKSKAELWLQYCMEAAKKGNIKTLIHAWDTGNERYWNNMPIPDLADRIADMINILLKSRDQNAISFGLKIYDLYKSNLIEKVDSQWADSVKIELLNKRLQSEIGTPDIRTLPAIIEKSLNKYNPKNTIENELLRRHLKEWIDHFCTSSPNTNWITSLLAILKNQKIKKLFLEEPEGYFFLCCQSTRLILKNAKGGTKKSSREELLMATLKAAIESKSNLCLKSMLELLEQFIQMNPEHPLSAELKQLLITHQNLWAQTFMPGDPNSLIRFALLMHELGLQEKLQSENHGKALQAFLELANMNPEQMLENLDLFKTLFFTPNGNIREDCLPKAIEIIDALLSNKYPEIACEWYSAIKTNKKNTKSISSAIQSQLPGWVKKIAGNNAMPLNSFSILTDYYEEYPEHRPQAIGLISNLPYETIKKNLAHCLKIIDHALNTNANSLFNKKNNVFISNVLLAELEQNVHSTPNALSILLNLLQHSPQSHPIEWILLLNEISTKGSSSLRQQAWDCAKSSVLSYSLIESKIMQSGYEKYISTMIQGWTLSYINTSNPLYSQQLENYFQDAVKALDNLPPDMQFIQTQQLYLHLYITLVNLDADRAPVNINEGLLNALINTFKRITPYMDDPLNPNILTNQCLKLLLVKNICNSTNNEIFKEGYKIFSNLIKESNGTLIAIDDVDISHHLFRLIYFSLIGNIGKPDDEITKLALQMSEYLNRHQFLPDEYGKIIIALLRSKNEKLTKIAFHFVDLWINEYQLDLLKYQDDPHLRGTFHIIIHEGISSSDKEILCKTETLIENDIIKNLLSNHKELTLTPDELKEKIRLRHLEIFHASLNESIKSKDPVRINKAAGELVDDIQILIKVSLDDTVQNIKRLSLTPFYFKENNKDKLEYIESLSTHLLACLEVFPTEKHPDKIQIWHNLVQHYTACLKAIPLPENIDEQHEYMNSLSHLLDCFSNSFSQVPTAGGQEKFNKFLEESISILLLRFNEYSKNITSSSSQEADNNAFHRCSPMAQRFSNQLTTMQTKLAPLSPAANDAVNEVLEVLMHYV